MSEGMNVPQPKNFTEYNQLFPEFAREDTLNYKMAHYPDIVRAFQAGMEQFLTHPEAEDRMAFLEGLKRTYGEMSEMVFEYYQAMEEMIATCENQLKRENTPANEVVELPVIFTGMHVITWELPVEDRYETSPYEVFVNGVSYGQRHTVISSISGLEENKYYHIELLCQEMRYCADVVTKEEVATLDVRSFGAVGDGVHNDTTAIQTAFMCCQPGMRVWIPAGNYKITALFLTNDLTVELARGAVLSAFTDRSMFPILPGRVPCKNPDDFYNLGSWEGNPLDMFGSIFTGIHVKNVVICGEGIIDGNANFENWWKEPKKKIGGAWRPRMIFLNHCENVVVQGITVQNSPAWNVHPYFSNHLRFLDMKILGPANSHNTDGLDPESCEDVEIAGVFFSVGDDCIAIKSGKIYMGRRFQTPCKNIRIRQSCMRDGHGAITVGSEIAAGLQQFSVEKCLFLHTDRGLRVKTRRGRGRDSVLEDLTFREITMDQVKAPFVVNSFYFCDPDGRTDYVGSQLPLPVDERTPEIDYITLENITCTNCHWCATYITGLPERKIKKITIKNVSFTYAEEATLGQPAMMTACKECSKLGIFASHVEEISLENVSITGQNGEAEVFEDVDLVTEVSKE